MTIPPKGSLVRSHYELGVRVRQLGRALAHEAPLLGTVGTIIAGWPVFRDLYASPKTIARSDALTGRRHPTLAYRVWTVLSYGAVGVAVVALVVGILVGR